MCWSLTGRGESFGKPGAEGNAAGRWSQSPPPGDWLAKRRGHNERHFNRLVLSVREDGSARELPLFDEDEFLWAVLARGLSLGAREHARLVDVGEELEVQLSFPPPQQLERLLTLYGVRVGAWSWMLRERSLQAGLREALEGFGVEVRGSTP